MGWASWAAAMRMRIPPRNCEKATMPEEKTFPPRTDDEEAGCRNCQDDQDDSIVLDSKFPADFDLRRLQGIDCLPLATEAAESTENHGGESYVDGLITPSDEVAKALSQRGGVLFPLGDSGLSGESKEVVNDSVVIYLDNHVDSSDSGDGDSDDSSWWGKQMCQEQGEHFSYEKDEDLGAHEWPEDDHLTLSVETARKLANEDRELSFSSLSELSPEAAKSLAQHRGDLYLFSLTTLSDEAAEALAQHKGDLHLDGLTTLSDEAAQALSQYKGWLTLSGLTTLSAEAAQSLAQYKGWLSLDGLTALSDEAAKALAKHKGESLELNGLTTLSSEAAKALAKYKGISLELNGLKILSDEAAEALARYRNALHLDGLTTLSDEAAKALGRHTGVILSLNGLTTISEEAAKALAQRKWQFFHKFRTLNGLTALSDEAAKALSQTKSGLFLRGLTTLSDEAANALRANRHIFLPEKFR